MKQLSIRRLKEERKKHGKTQKDVADFLGMTKQAVQRYESGLSNPKLETWEKLADLYNTDIAFLQGYTDIRNTSDIDTKVSISELIKTIDKVGTERFNKSIHQQNIESDSDKITPVLNALDSHSANNDNNQDFSYNENITNPYVRSILLNSFQHLKFIALLSQKDDRILTKIFDYISAIEASLVNSADEKNKEPAD